MMKWKIKVIFAQLLVGKIQMLRWLMTLDNKLQLQNLWNNKSKIQSQIVSLKMYKNVNK